MKPRRRKLDQAVRVRVRGRRAQRVPRGTRIVVWTSGLWWSIAVRAGGSVHMSVPPLGCRLELSRQRLAPRFAREAVEQLWLVLEVPAQAEVEFHPLPRANRGLRPRNVSQPKAA